MTPMLGIMASQISGHLASPTAYESIATVTAAGGESSMSFTSISSTYKHLQIRASNIKYQSDQDIKVTFNSTGGTSYAYHNLQGNGATATAGGATSQAFIDWMYIVNNASSPTIPIAGIMDILDYTNTNKYKTVRSLWGGDYNGSGNVALMSGLFQSTSAISTITFAPFSTNFIAGCTFALYGIKG